MSTMEGIVTLAQESRFQVTDDEGASHLFVLASSAGAQPSDLAALQQQQARVRLTWSKAPNLVARVAHRVALCPKSL